MSSPLHAQLSALAETHRECVALIARLAKLSGSSVEGVRSELASQIHESLKGSEAELELLRVQVESEPAVEVRETLSAKCSKLSEELKHARLQYRRAQLQSKKNAEAERKKERELLFGTADGGAGGGRPSLRNRKAAENQTQDDVVLSAASDVTTSLRRTHALLSAELQQSRFAQETLLASTQALKDLSTRYSRVDEIMMSSRRLITDLVRKNKSDAWYYEKAIYILAGTLAWLIFRRWLLGPLWLFVWLPFKWVWWCVLVMFGGGGGKSVAPSQPVVGRGGGKEAVVAYKETVSTAVVPEVERETKARFTESVESIIDGSNEDWKTPAAESPTPAPIEEAPAPEVIEEVPVEVPDEEEAQANPKRRVIEADDTPPEPEPAEGREIPADSEETVPNPMKRMYEEPEPEPEPEKRDEAPADSEETIPNPMKRMYEEPEAPKPVGINEQHDEL